MVLLLLLSLGYEIKNAVFSSGGVRSAEPITGQVYGRLVVPSFIM